MKKLFSIIAAILKGIGRSFTILRSLVLNFVFLLVIIIILISFFQSRDVVIDDNVLLTLSITGKIVEQKSQTDPLGEAINEIVGFATPVEETYLQDILDVIAHAEDDPKIKGILLDLATMDGAGMDKLAVIGSRLEQFRQTGKPVIAAEDFYSQNQYYLASHADKIFINPMGGVYLNGFGLYRLYFKDALEKLQVNYHVFKVGSFKSAIEPITRNSMSPEDRFQSRTWLNGLWDNYARDVARQRNIDPAEINNYINMVPNNLKKAEGNLAQLAKNYNLVDEIQPRHKIRNYLASLSAPETKHGFKQVAFSNYLKKVHRSYQYDGTDQDTVALIVAQGTIVPGSNRPGTIGAESLTSLLRLAADTPSVKAVVLRVDSGGGSAFASEVIRQEILELKKTGKPVVVSMGSIAASGAYWIAADADRIFASENSLTGSIGIFMAVPTFENTLNNLGIHRDGVGTTNLSGALDLSAPLSAEVKQAVELTLEHGYRTFLAIVAEGRDMQPDKVEIIAQGRVYAGENALEAGLVDQLGSLPDALRSAAELAGIEDYRTRTLSATGSLGNRLLRYLDSSSLLAGLEQSLFISAINRLLPGEIELPHFLLFNDPNGMYAHCMISSYSSP
ncbi:MAG: signal peptide peptidase SppA [Desulfocapsaceae bacterium]|jgi:protease-4|nr:signal peptide peptidase SppA [Desulfocapsaceae bacterium]